MYVYTTTLKLTRSLKNQRRLEGKGDRVSAGTLGARADQWQKFEALFTYWKER